VSNGFAIRLAAVALLAATIAGCAPLRGFFSDLRAPRVSDEWTALLDEVRAFERRIGFEETDNFLDFSNEQEAFPFCGYASRFYLPYSYEDPAIRWLDPATEQECRKIGRGADAFFGRVEVWGEIGTPVTPSMLGSKLDRFLYLVIHEDCHDQFELPYGIEEALCNLITYKAMAAFSREKFGLDAREHRVIRRYADRQSELTRATKAVYEQLEMLYARYERKEMPSDALVQERAAIYSKAKRTLEWKRGELNNVGLASDMTYSRHYTLLEDVYDALGGDLALTVAFFRRVDTMKPSKFEVMKRHGIAADDGVDFIRAYEAAVVETIKKAMTN
jgi:hypothetical protein